MIKPLYFMKNPPKVLIFDEDLLLFALYLLLSFLAGLSVVLIRVLIDSVFFSWIAIHKHDPLPATFITSKKSRDEILIFHFHFTIDSLMRIKASRNVKEN